MQKKILFVDDKEMIIEGLKREALGLGATDLVNKPI